MTRKKHSAKARMTAAELKEMLAEDRDLLKTIIEQRVQQVLEADGAFCFIDVLSAGYTCTKRLDFALPQQVVV